MRKFFPLLLTCLIVNNNAFSQGKVGINTTTPQALLHVKDSSVLFSGLLLPLVTPGNPPANGQGVRMMWYPDKAAFRAGFVTGAEWDKDNIGYYSTALGTNTIASGTTSIAAGYATKSSGYISTAFGNGTTASGDYSTSVGNLTIAKPFASVALGQFNDTSSISSGSWNLLDPVFIIGNGITGNARNNAMTVLKNANTGINTANPQALLHIVRIGTSGGPFNGNAVAVLESNQHSYIQFSQTNDKESGFLSGNNLTTIRSALLFGADSSIMFRTGGNNTRMMINKTGKVGINTTTPQAMLHVKDSSVLFTGAATLPGTAGNPPVIGAGVRMMWYPDKAAFRVGMVSAASWDKDSIGDYSFAAGNNTKAKGNNSVAFGVETNASGDYSTTLGRITMAKPFSSVVLGQYNDTSSISSTSWNLLDPVFIIGNGTADNARSNAMTVLKNAKTGINIGNPLAGLHIKGIESTFDAHIRLETAGGGTDYANILYDGNMKFKTFTAGDEYQWRNSANNTTMTLEDAGNLYIDGNLGVGTTSPGAKMKVNGTTILGTNGTALTEIIKLTVTKDIAAVALNSSNPETFAVANCALTSTVYVSPASPLTNGLIIAFARVSVAGTVEVTFTNTTGAIINMPSMDYYITVIR